MDLREYPLTLPQIVAWLRSKELSLAGSAVSLVDIRERTDYVPAAAADFDGINSMGRIIGWVSGAFDFEALRASDGKDILWHHVDVTTVEELEPAYADFFRIMQTPALDQEST